jgi:hypothetical protein
MLVTVRFLLPLISISVRFALHLSLLSNLQSCLSFSLLLSARCSWLVSSLQNVLVAAILLLRSLLLFVWLLFVAAPAAALRGCSCGGSSWLLQAALAAPVGDLSGYIYGRSVWLPLWCSFLLFPRALSLAASTGALARLCLRRLLLRVTAIVAATSFYRCSCCSW